ncbi:PQQ-like beta-propeller repeat protein [Micromonospora sp. NBC_01699]|uniref:outer membrane protein assembly factor BamB family protein n=1 Tax=Micromonospora sp. NBC_01699 TaxID=2975984 RepID=UPI002E36A961|nr:PQQ-binding-like beta-propeller repeat protein [Micromonospora sp. NBC_01699]
MLVIDLGTIPDDPVEVESRRPLTWRRLRPAALALVVALLLTTGGSGLPPTPVIDHIATLSYPSTAQTNGFPSQGVLLTEKLLFTATMEPGGLIWLVSAHELDRGRRVWTYQLPSTSERQPELAYRSGLLLLSAAGTDQTGMRTVALHAATGRQRWSLPYHVQTFHGADHALAVDVIFADDSTLTDGSRWQGSSYGSPWGRTYGHPPLGRVVTGIALSTGEVRWRSELLTDVEIDIAARFSDDEGNGPDREHGLAVVTADGAVELRNARTAEVRHRFPAVHPDSRVQLNGDLLIVAHSATEVTAYSSETYQRRWIRPIGENGLVGFCGYGGLVCGTSGSGAWMIDADTGRRLWPIPREHVITEAGGHLIEFVTGGSLRPLRTVDPLTGEPRLPLLDWQRADIMPGGRVLFVAPQTHLGPTWLAVLTPGAVTPVSLGSVPVGLSGCQLTSSVIVCSTPHNDLRIWRYRAPVQSGAQ